MKIDKLICWSHCLSFFSDFYGNQRTKKRIVFSICNVTFCILILEDFIAVASKITGQCSWFVNAKIGICFCLVGNSFTSLTVSLFFINILSCVLVFTSWEIIFRHFINVLSLILWGYKYINIRLSLFIISLIK